MAPLLSLIRKLVLVSAAFVAPALATGDTAPLPRLHVTVKGDGPDVVLIPGWGCSGNVWDGTVETLSRSYRCHVVTLPGFAGQPPVDGAFLQTRKEALATYLHSAGIKRPVLIGHSLGGLLSLQLLIDPTSDVAAAVIVDSVPAFASIHQELTAEQTQSYAQQFRASLAQGTRDAFLAFCRQNLSMLVREEQNRARVFPWLEASDHATLIDGLVDVTATDVRGQLGEVRQPVLVVQAGYGPGAVPAEVFARQYASLPQVRQVRIDEAQHFVMLDQPEAFAAQIVPFLAEVSVKASPGAQR